MNKKLSIPKFKNFVSTLPFLGCGISSFYWFFSKYKVCFINSRSNTLHRGVFCQFPFHWVYYYDSKKSTGKEIVKTHLHALVSLQRICLKQTLLLVSISGFSGLKGVEKNIRKIKKKPYLFTFQWQDFSQDNATLSGTLLWHPKHYAGQGRRKVLKSGGLKAF